MSRRSTRCLGTVGKSLPLCAMDRSSARCLPFCEHNSYCILLTFPKTKEASEKLAVLERTNDGFKVAEADWELRGPGDLLGTAQSGLPVLKVGNLRTDAHLMLRARAAAVSILERDARLELPENQRFRRLIVEQQGRTFSNVS